MTLTLTCTACRQMFRIDEHKPGKRVRCPKCEAVFRLPETSPPAVPGRTATAPAALAMSSAVDAAPLKPIGDDIALPSSTPAPPRVAGQADRPQVSSPDGVVVPRKVIYLQGFLLGFVALGCFAFGLHVGRQSSLPAAGEVRAQPCIVSGRIMQTDSDGQRHAEPGAVVILLPQDARPEDKLPIDGLRPGSQERPSAVDLIRQIGGDYARTDGKGHYRLRAARTGECFLLVLSATQTRTLSDDFDRRQLAQIGRYFSPVPALLEGNAFAWKELLLRHDRTVNHVFP